MATKKAAAKVTKPKVCNTQYYSPYHGVSLFRCVLEQTHDGPHESELGIKGMSRDKDTFTGNLDWARKSRPRV